MYIKKYNMFLESLNIEKQIIINKIIPFINKKYELLSNWAQKKMNIKTETINKMVFEKTDNSWELTLVVSGWSSNKGNRIIGYVLSKYIREIFEKYKINFKLDKYSGVYSILNKEDKEYIIFDNINKKEIN